MRVVFVTPPPIKPSEPGLSAGAAAEVARRLGIDACSIDASIAWHAYALERGRLERALAPVASPAPGRLAAWRRAVDALDARPPALRRESTYQDRQRYTSAVQDLENALDLAASPWPGVRLGVASIALPRRVESSACLADFAAAPGPFDDYFVDGLLPALERAGATHVGVSLAFQQQAPAAFRLAALLRERAPGVRRILGGPLVACWLAAGIGLARPPFDLFDAILAGTDEGLARLGGWGEIADEMSLRARGPLAGALDEAPWDRYLAPVPIVPAALGRGCSWRRCTFCPDPLHAAHRPCTPDSLAPWLRAVAGRFPCGAMLHLTDSALPPAYLLDIARVIRDEGLPLRWHGFVRVEEAFADPGVARDLAAGGCAMLQFGVESGSPRMLERMGKGAGPDLARRALQATAAAGIRNHVYLLFGMPGETDADREATLDLCARLGAAVHAVNPALLNLPRGSAIHRAPERHGITRLVPFHADTDLSLYEDFRCGDAHPRVEARRWLARRFFKSDVVRSVQRDLRSPFKANHLCFL